MLETDYLIVGSGAVGMAFADTLLTETDASIIIVDRYAKPGGHWNYAYPFVRLHQPSQFYGVSSRELSNGIKNKIGLNQGLYSLASGAEVSAYFDEVMNDTFLPTGRVQYFPLCNYHGNYEFESKLTGKRYQVKVRQKLVDCTYLNTTVPSTHTPNFTIAEGVAFMPLNNLPQITTPPAGYVVIGGGKTGIDACLWLLENQVDPDDITWVISRDAWLLDRRNTQPAEEFFNYSIGAQAAQVEAIAQSTSIPDMFDRLEASGVLVRIDTRVRPQMFHGATISQLELEQLRRIRNTVRLGKVQSIEKDRIILDKGTIPTSADHIHVDCSASAITNLATRPIFEEGTITPQTIRPYQPVFSASVIAYVEGKHDDMETKNKLCQVVPLPNSDTDWVRMTAAQMENQLIWSGDRELRHWIRLNRLDGFSHLVRSIDKKDAEKMAILRKMRKYAMPAMAKLQQFIADLEAVPRSKLQNPQFQVKKDVFLKNRLVNIPSPALALNDGELLLKVEKFAYTANNITYAAAGDMIGYWQFFPPEGADSEGWGIIPVWGFAEVAASNSNEIPVGERLFGYFPPARYVKMYPVNIRNGRFIDGSAHRAKLPAGYNLYRRVNQEPNYDPALDRERMLLFPLHLTSFCLWDALREKNWYGARQIVILSASSKTSTGLAYALKADATAPAVIGMTSKRNLKAVESLQLYNECCTYDQVTSIDARQPSIIVDMAGNTKVLAALHTHLGDNMKFTYNVGLTHWTNTKPQADIMAERCQFFFAPGHIQSRIKEWGPEGFEEKTTAFLKRTAAQTRTWLRFKKVEGLQALAAIHPAVCAGTISPKQGLIVEV